MPSKVSLTVGSLLAVSVIIAVASRLSCVADLFSSYAAPGEKDEFMDDCDNLEAHGTPSDLGDSDSYGGSSDDESSDEGCSEYKIVSEGRIPFYKDQTEAGTAPVNEREAGACTAWPSAADAFHGERLESVPRVAGVEESGDEDQEEAPVKSLDDMEASPGSLPSDRPYDADDDADDDDDDADDDDDNVWDMLQSLAKELEDAQKNSSTLRLQLDEARADVCALQTRVAQHETRARFVSEDLDVAIEDNDTLHAQNRRLQARLQEASNEIATLREGLAAASHALKGRETELWGTRRALQGLREAHVELIEAATKGQSSNVGSLSLDERIRGR